MPTYSIDRQWADLLIPQVKTIVGPHLLIDASAENDQREATDLIVLKARDMRIGARVRRPGYADKYRYEFTLRCQRDSGVETELSKIVNGWGDMLFYGHADNAGKIWLWWLVDLHSFRAALIRDRQFLRSGKTPNGDGTYFAWFDIRSFPKQPPILAASSHPLLTVLDQPRTLFMGNP